MTAFAEVAAASDAAAATRSRLAKVAAFVALLEQLAVEEVPVVVAILSGAVRQGRIGVGWATVARYREAEPAPSPTLSVLDVDDALGRLAAASGPGSVAARTAILEDLFARATDREADLLRRLLLGELRQGALTSLVTDAVAEASGVPVAAVRRAAMLAGDLPEVAALALHGGAGALAGIGLTVGTPVQPMLAATAESVGDALALHGGEASVEWKLDGARIQAHRSGDDVRLFTRNLNDVTARLPGIVALVRSFPADRLVLDGEAIGWSDDGTTPGVFQDTMSSFGRQAGGAGAHLAARFFDVLHVDGVDLLDEPLRARIEVLDRVAGGAAIPRLVTADAAAAEAFAEATLAAGHEGVMVKALDSVYDAGRRGGAWRKVKPVRTLDLVVLAVEWGGGRRRGWLSNLHLGARGAVPGEFVMVGKTFKGLSDALLAWQTEQLLAREVRREGHVVVVRPELVVEIALDGVQRSTRYPGGVALRFARVKRYRDDKGPADADTIEAVRALLPGR